MELPVRVNRMQRLQSTVIARRERLKLFLKIFVDSLFNYFYQISLNYKEMWAIRGLNMDLFTKRLGEKIHEKRKAVESADSDISEKYGWVVKLCVLDGVSRRWIMDEMKETPEEIIDYVMPIIKTL